MVRVVAAVAMSGGVCRGGAACGCVGGVCAALGWQLWLVSVHPVLRRCWVRCVRRVCGRVCAEMLSVSLWCCCCRCVVSEAAGRGGWVGLGVAHVVRGALRSAVCGGALVGG